MRSKKYHRPPQPTGPMLSFSASTTVTYRSSLLPIRDDLVGSELLLGFPVYHCPGATPRLLLSNNSDHQLDRLPSSKPDWRPTSPVKRPQRTSESQASLHREFRRKISLSLSSPNASETGEDFQLKHWGPRLLVQTLFSGNYRKFWPKLSPWRGPKSQLGYLQPPSVWKKPKSRCKHRKGSNHLLQLSVTRH